MWLSWGCASRVGELTIHKIIVHKTNEDCFVSIDELGLVLSILLAIVILQRILPILLLVLNVLVLLIASARNVPLGGAHSGSKKRLKLSRACEEGRLVSVDFLCISLLLESISMLEKQHDENNDQYRILREMIIMSENMLCWILIFSSRKISGSERIHEYETIMRRISIIGKRRMIMP